MSSPRGNQRERVLGEMTEASELPSSGMAVGGNGSRADFLDDMIPNSWEVHGPTPLGDVDVPGESLYSVVAPHAAASIEVRWHSQPADGFSCLLMVNGDREMPLAQFCTTSKGDAFDWLTSAVTALADMDGAEPVHLAPGPAPARSPENVAFTGPVTGVNEEVPRAA
jgi:hypothetical protein